MSVFSDYTDAQVAAFGTAQIAALSTAQIAALGTDLSRLTSLQTAAFSATQIRAIDDPSLFTSKNIVGLSAKQLARSRGR